MEFFFEFQYGMIFNKTISSIVTLSRVKNQN